MTDGPIEAKARLMIVTMISRSTTVPIYDAVKEAGVEISLFTPADAPLCPAGDDPWRVIRGLRKWIMADVLHFCGTHGFVDLPTTVPLLPKSVPIIWTIGEEDLSDDSNDKIVAAVDCRSTGNLVIAVPDERLNEASKNFRLFGKFDHHVIQNSLPYPYLYRAVRDRLRAEIGSK